MRLALSLSFAGLRLVACQDPEVEGAEAKQKLAWELSGKGRVALADGKFEEAVKLIKQAADATPRDPGLYLLLARAQKAAGNDTAAVLAIKQAEDLGARNDPAIRRERAEL